MSVVNWMNRLYAIIVSVCPDFPTRTWTVGILSPHLQNLLFRQLHSIYSIWFPTSSIRSLDTYCHVPFILGVSKIFLNLADSSVVGSIVTKAKVTWVDTTILLQYIRLYLGLLKKVHRLDSFALFKIHNVIP